jgi:hypothetical protein
LNLIDLLCVSTNKELINIGSKTMKKYFLHNEKEQQGPYDIEELEEMQITRETSVWFEGLSDWTSAGQLDELKSLFDASIPPPFKSLKPSYPPKKDTAKDFNSTNKRSAGKKSNDVLIILIIVLLLIIVGGGFFFVNQKISNNGDGSSTRNDSVRDSYQENVLTIKEIERLKPRKFLKAAGNYDKNIWGNKLKVHGIIKNSATVTTYRDATVRVTFYSSKKSVLGKMDQKLGETFPPQSEIKFELKVENYKNVDSIGWSVIQAIPN